MSACLLGAVQERFEREGDTRAEQVWKDEERALVQCTKGERGSQERGEAQGKGKLYKFGISRRCSGKGALQAHPVGVRSGSPRLGCLDSARWRRKKTNQLGCQEVWLEATIRVQAQDAFSHCAGDGRKQETKSEPGEEKQEKQFSGLWSMPDPAQETVFAVKLSLSCHQSHSRFQVAWGPHEARRHPQLLSVGPAEPLLRERKPEGLLSLDQAADHNSLLAWHQFNEVPQDFMRGVPLGCPFYGRGN